MAKVFQSEVILFLSSMKHSNEYLLRDAGEGGHVLGSQLQAKICGWCAEPDGRGSASIVAAVICFRTCYVQLPLQSLCFHPYIICFQ
jgi:hypothetical protein